MLPSDYFYTGEQRTERESFATWYNNNHLRLNADKTNGEKTEIEASNFQIRMLHTHLQPRKKKKTKT